VYVSNPNQIMVAYWSGDGDFSATLYIWLRVAEQWLMAGIKSNPGYNIFPYFPMGRLVSQFFSFFPSCFDFVSCLYV